MIDLFDALLVKTLMLSEGNEIAQQIEMIYLHALIVNEHRGVIGLGGNGTERAQQIGAQRLLDTGAVFFYEKFGI